MTESTLKQSLRNRYTPERAHTLLQTLFGDTLALFSHPGVLAENQEAIRLARQTGSVTLADGRNLALFDVEVTEAVSIDRNRKGLRDMAAQYIDQGIIHGALVFFHCPKQTEYRLTFVARYATFNLETGELERQETQPKRYSFLLGPGESGTTAARQLMTLVEKKQVSLQDLTDAFSVEKLNREFFKQYKAQYERFWRYLSEHYRPLFLGNTPPPEQAKEKEKQEKPLRDFAQKLLGRIVFLHFLQKKGWMGCSPGSPAWTDGDKQFMQTLFGQFQYPAEFYSRCLTKLFFETLNAERANDLFDVAGLLPCKVPYLNGGLFDPDPSDKWAIDFPADYFRELLAFFDQYNFTIDENRPDDHEVGIDPEMLGRIFENLLEENREKGVFYTPREIVQYICQESLIQYLNHHLTEALEEPHRQRAQESLATFIRYGNRGDEKDKDNFIYQYAPQIEEVLDAVKICDPAIGSGAFPMGMLQEIFAAKLSLDWTLNRARERSEVKKRIIQDSIYGVDIDNGAVDIARLRFWLALVVDEEQPQPLPNLDYKVMQGNSLLESFEGIALDQLLKEQKVVYVIENGQMDLFGQVADPQIRMAFSDEKKQKLEELLRLFFDSEALKRRKLKKETVKEQIEAIVHDHLEYNFELTELSLERQINEKQQQISGLQTAIQNNPNDTKMRRQQKEKLRIQLEKQATSLQRELEEVLAKKEKLYALNPNNRPYFLWHLFFKDALDSGGFDIMIGNPPYIQLSKLKQEASQYQQEGYETFERTGDIYCLFYEQGIQLLRPGGILTYITSNSWLQTQYGQSLRTYFIWHTDPLVLLNFEDTRLFETAVVEANILLTRKLPPNAFCQYQLQAATVGSDYDRQIDLATYVKQHGFSLTDLPIDGWNVGNAEAIRLKKQMENVGKKLINWSVSINYGIKTGYNPAFIIDEIVYNELMADPRNKEIIKPTLRGRDLKRYTYTFSQQWMIVSHNGLKEEKLPAINVASDYPSIYHFLEKFLPDIQQRYDQGNHWSNLRNCAYLRDFDKPKIIWGELSDEAKFAYDESGSYLNNTIFMLTGELLKYLLAILNSKAARWYFKQISTTSGMGTNRWLKYKVEQLPVPEPDSDTEQQITQLVDKVLDLKREHPNAETVSYEAQIDALVFKLYGLRETEVLYILDQDERLGNREREMIHNNFRNLERGNFVLSV